MEEEDYQDYHPCLCQASCKVACACKRSAKFCADLCSCKADSCTNRGVMPSPEMLANPAVRCTCKLQFCQTKICACYRAGRKCSDLCRCPKWCKNKERAPPDHFCICTGPCDYGCTCHDLGRFCFEHCACSAFNCQNRGVMAAPPMADPRAPRCSCKKNQCTNNGCSCRKSGHPCTHFCTCTDCCNDNGGAENNAQEEDNGGAENNAQEEDNGGAENNAQEEENAHEEDNAP